MTTQVNQNIDVISGDEIIVAEDIGHLTPDVQSEVDTQIATARRYPRDIQKVTQEALTMATFNEDIAAGCMYSLPRGGKPIEGPSVRLAEIMVSAWGNFRADARVIEIGETMLTAEALAWDLEKNVAIRVQVKRRITDKNNRRYSEDMIVVTGNAACAIALRNAVFKVIPRVYTDVIYQQARRAAVGDIQTLEARRAGVIEHFGKMGVPAERVFAAVGKTHIEGIGLDELAVLKGLATAIKDGDTSIDEAFPAKNAELVAVTEANIKALKEQVTAQREAKS